MDGVISNGSIVDVAAVDYEDIQAWAWKDTDADVVGLDCDIWANRYRPFI